MTKRTRLALTGSAVLLLAVSLLPLRVDAQKTDRAKRLGDRLMCMCSCNQILTQCNHVGCQVSASMLKDMDRYVAGGESDDMIVQKFVQQYGEKVMNTPPSNGFNSIAWYIPGVAFALGLAIVGLVIRSWSNRHTLEAATATAAPAPGAGSPGSVNDEYDRARRQADRETEE